MSFSNREVLKFRQKIVKHHIYSCKHVCIRVNEFTRGSIKMKDKYTIACKLSGDK